MTLYHILENPGTAVNLAKTIKFERKKNIPPSLPPQSLTITTLHREFPKYSVFAFSCFIVSGMWVRYYSLVWLNRQRAVIQGVHNCFDAGGPHNHSKAARESGSGFLWTVEKLACESEMCWTRVLFNTSLEVVACLLSKGSATKPWALWSLPQYRVSERVAAILLPTCASCECVLLLLYLLFSM